MEFRNARHVGKQSAGMGTRWVGLDLSGRRELHGAGCKDRAPGIQKNREQQEGTGPGQGGGPVSDEQTSARRAWYYPPTTSRGAGELLKFQTNQSNSFIGCPLSFSAGQGHCIGSFRVIFFNGNLLPYTPGSEVTPALGSCPEVRRKRLCYLCQRTSCLCFVLFCFF